MDTDSYIIDLWTTWYFQAYLIKLVLNLAFEPMLFIVLKSLSDFPEIFCGFEIVFCVYQTNNSIFTTFEIFKIRLQT